MKKICTIVLFILIATLTYSQNNKPVVAATASMIADMTTNIAGDKLEVKCIVPVGGDPHIYNPTPDDAKLVANANLVLKNGLTFEGWLDELIENSGTKAAVVTVTDGIEVIKSLDYDSPDPHAWMDVQKAKGYCKNIAKALTDLMPEEQAFFEENLKKYLAELEALDAYILTEIKKIPEDKRILITSHDAFQYFGRRYGLQLEAVMGVSTDAEVQTEDVINLQKLIKKTKVPAVFVESTVNPKLLKQIAKDNGIRIGGKLLADSLGDEKIGGETYVKMMRLNTQTIVSGLNAATNEKNMEEVNQPSSTSNYIMTGVIVLFFLAGFGMMYGKMK